MNTSLQEKAKVVLTKHQVTSKSHASTQIQDIEALMAQAARRQKPSDVEEEPKAVYLTKEQMDRNAEKCRQVDVRISEAIEKARKGDPEQLKGLYKEIGREYTGQFAPGWEEPEAVYDKSKIVISHTGLTLEQAEINYARNQEESRLIKLACAGDVGPLEAFLGEKLDPAAFAGATAQQAYRPKFYPTDKSPIEILPAIIEAQAKCQGDQVYVLFTTDGLNRYKCHLAPYLKMEDLFYEANYYNKPWYESIRDTVLEKRMTVDVTKSGIQEARYGCLTLMAEGEHIHTYQQSRNAMPRTFVIATWSKDEEPVLTGLTLLLNDPKTGEDKAYKFNMKTTTGYYDYKAIYKEKSAKEVAKEAEQAAKTAWALKSMSRK